MEGEWWFPADSSYLASLTKSLARSLPGNFLLRCRNRYICRTPTWGVGMQPGPDSSTLLILGYKLITAASEQR